MSPLDLKIVTGILTFVTILNLVGLWVVARMYFTHLDTMLAMKMGDVKLSTDQLLARATSNIPTIGGNK